MEKSVDVPSGPIFSLNNLDSWLVGPVDAEPTDTEGSRTHGARLPAKSSLWRQRLIFASRFGSHELTFM